MKHFEIIPPGLQEFIWLHFNAETLQSKADSDNKAPSDGWTPAASSEFLS